MKKRYIDFKGTRFGMLKVIEVYGRATNRTILWKCLCDCGNYTIVRANHLKNGHTKSCGCYHKEKLTNLYVKNIIGERFGRLVVKARSNKKVQNAAVWECVCDCGNYVEVHTASLINKHTQSCGCLQFDMVWKGGKSLEEYCEVWKDQEYKQDIRDRDGNQCLNPDCWGKDKILSVHHIDYDKKNCSPKNLITVCRSCNSRANYDRKWHTAWYQAILNRRYDYEY